MWGCGMYMYMWNVMLNPYFAPCFSFGYQVNLEARFYSLKFLVTNNRKKKTCNIMVHPVRYSHCQHKLNRHSHECVTIASLRRFGALPCKDLNNEFGMVKVVKSNNSK